MRNVADLRLTSQRTITLERWLHAFSQAYPSIDPRMIHMDKDVAEINASRRAFPRAAVRLCAWHRKRTLRILTRY